MANDGDAYTVMSHEPEELLLSQYSTHLRRGG
jgi:hypothetical protein